MLRRLPASPAAVGVAVLAFHLLWIAGYFAVGHDVRDFVRIGTSYVNASEVSDVIEIDPDYRYPPNRDGPQGVGYDGQFSYYLAVDFGNAHHYMDLPPYRYTRILHPALASLLAGGRPELVPYTLLGINLLAVGGATLVLAAWLRRRRCSPWLAAIYGLYPGLLIGLQRDLTEPLAYGLVPLGVYLLDFGGRWRVVGAGGAFALAGLARPSTLLFPAIYAASLLQRGTGGQREWRDAVLLGGLALAPVAAYALYVFSWLGPPPRQYWFTPLPFGGLFESRPWQLVREPVIIVTVLVPAAMIAAASLRSFRRSVRQPAIWCLLTGALLFLVLASKVQYESGYTAMGARDTIGVVLAALLSVPYLKEAGGTTRRLAWGAAAIAMSMLPVVLVYGFVDIRV